MVSRLAPVPKAPKPKRAKNVMTGVSLIGQMPVLEHVRNGHEGKVWRLWLSYDENYTTGVYLQLGNNGDIFRYSLNAGRIMKADRIKDED